jgi:plastocyanin
MGSPGKIAFPVILVLGAITGFITYNYFTAAIPEEGRIDSPYYQPLSPASGGNQTGSTGEAVQTAGGGNQTAGGGNQTAGGGNQTAGGGNQTAGGGNQTAGGGNQTAGGGGGAVGGPTINILEGAAVQGSPDYDPEDLTAKKGDEVTVVNQDTVPHTVTSGTGSSDPNSAKSFDTSIINGGESATISLAQVEPGQYDYYCMIHPYMNGKITVG